MKNPEMRHPKRKLRNARRKLTRDGVGYFQELDQGLHQKLTSQGR